MYKNESRTEPVLLNFYSIAPEKSEPMEHSVSVDISDRVQDAPRVWDHGNSHSLMRRRGDVEMAVSVRNLCKSYEEGKPVLNDMSMSVRRGTIYGLLGASGCGKTTLLSSIVGLERWDSGEILLFGKKCQGPPGRIIGYMPQDISLYDQLTILEMIRYFGRLYGLPKTVIDEQYRWLVDFLQLPTKFQLICDLSGGQRRRVSLAVALAHSPDLLILDEPTVGLDPLLRESIWKYLLEISKTRQTTIIVTTHYIEEARYSNTIGVMRKGRLLVEDSPEAILQEYQCELLEHAVLKLCRKDQMTLANSNVERGKPAINKKSSTTSSQAVSPTGLEALTEILWMTAKLLISSCSTKEHSIQGKMIRDVWTRNSRQSMSVASPESLDSSPKKNSSNVFDRIKAMSIVLWLMYIRHPIFLVMVTFLPAIQIILSFLIVGTHPKDLKFGIVNEDMSYYDYCFQQDYRSKLLNGNTSCQFEDISCRLVTEISKMGTFKLVPIQSADEAVSQIQNGDLWGYFHFKKNYSHFFQDLVVSQRFSENETLEGSRVGIRLDMSNFLGSLFVIQDSFEAYNNFARSIAVSCDIDPRELTLPMEYKEPVYGKAGSTYADYILPIALLAVIFEVPLLVTPVVFIYDRKQGTLARSMAAGLRIKEVMASHFVSQGVITAVQIVICYVVMHFLYNFEVRGQYWLAYMICMWGGLSGVSFGLMLAVICREEVEVLMVGMLIGPALLLYGGAVWPIDGMNTVVRTCAKLLPPIIAESFRSVVYRGLGISHTFVWPGLVTNMMWVVFVCIVAIVVYIRKNK